VNDYERIERAFANLRESGIYAQQYFACCGTRGWAEATEPIEDSDEFVGFGFTSCQDYSDGYFGGQGTPMPPRVWPRIGHDEELCDAWSEEHYQEARLTVADLVGEMYLYWHTPDDDPTPIVAAVCPAGMTVSVNPDKTISVTTRNPERRQEIEDRAFDTAPDRSVELIEREEADPGDAAIRAMKSLPDDLLRYLDPQAFVRAMLVDAEDEAQR
jgi:hypothetical protein